MGGKIGSACVEFEDSEGGVLFVRVLVPVTQVVPESPGLSWELPGLSCINSITRLGLPGTRDRGRPRKTWSACVRNDMTICNLDGVNPLDRNSWRTSVRRWQVLPTPESGTTAAP